ncbi:MAG: hypothetical protein K0R20_1520 [Actinomycetia bacterium]|jgi:hypothetical protein|nr:hypothetical protein [Actinomycetes bacterium]
MAHHDEDRAHELVELDLEDRPDGPAAAAAFSAGFGIFVLGLLTMLSEVSVSLHDWLERWEFDQGVGPLAGKTTLAAIAWAVSWIVVAALLRKRDVNLKVWFLFSLVLGILGAIGTFPPIFLSFAPE